MMTTPAWRSRKTSRVIASKQNSRRSHTPCDRRFAFAQPLFALGGVGAGVQLFQFCYDGGGLPRAAQEQWS